MNSGACLAVSADWAFAALDARAVSGVVASLAHTRGEVGGALLESRRVLGAGLAACRAGRVEANHARGAFVSTKSRDAPFAARCAISAAFGRLLSARLAEQAAQREHLAHERLPATGGAPPPFRSITRYGF